MAFSLVSNTLTDSTPGNLAMACCTCCVHSAQSMPLTGTSSVCDFAMGGLLGIVARAFVNALGNISQQLIGKAEQLPYARIAECIVYKAPFLLGRHQPTIAQATQMIRDVRLC